MARSELRPVLRHIRTLAGPPVAAPPTDAQLLRAFAGHHDEAAFAELVQRHGSLVLSVCRRLLRHAQDAEDAFQATFLVLSRKAASIRQGQSLASWLYGVARRTALHLRMVAARKILPPMHSPMPQPDPPAEASLRELQQLLDEEVSRLPQKYRAPFVLCCLEGHSRAEAAQQLGWNEGTLSGRLALARQRLQQRLARRGVSLTAVLAAVALGPGASAGVPVALAGVTVEAAMRLAAGLAVGAFSLQAVALAEATVRAMSRTRINIAALVLLFLTLAGAGAGVYAFGGLLEKSGQGDRLRAESPPAPAPDRPRTDRFGDPLPPGAISRLGTLRFRTWADRVAFLPGDKVLATIGREAVSFWDVDTGKETRRTVDMRWGEAAALSADGKWLAVSAVPNDSTIHLWDVKSGTNLRQLKGFRGRTRTLVFAADGRALVSGGLDNTVRVWDTDTGKELRRIEVGHPVEGLAISADGKTLACAGWDVASTVSVRETDTGKELHRYRLPLGVGQVAFAPDGKTLAAVEDWNDDGGVRENKVHLWDTRTGKLRRQLALREHILCLAFSPDSKTLATGHLDTFHVWDVNTGKWLARFEGHSGRTNIMTFSGDGKTLATGGDSTLRLWDVLVTGKEIPAPGNGHQGAVHALAFLPDGKTLVTGGEDHTLRHWEAATGKEVRRFPGMGGGVFRPSFAAARVLAVPAHQEVRLCDPVTGKELHRFRFPDHVRQVALTPDGKTLIAYTGGKDRTLRFVDTDTGKERLTRRSQEFVQAMALSPDGEFLALGPVDPVLRLLDTATLSEVFQLRLRENVTSMAFSPDGKTLVWGAGCGPLHFWEVVTGKERARRPDRDLRSGSTMAFSPDGRVLALGDSDGTLRLCLAGTGKELRRLPGHRNGITCLAFSADGKTLASGSWDTTVLVWDVCALLDRKAEQAGNLKAGQLETLWADLAGDDAVAAYQAIQKLAAAPRQALPLLRARLRPVATVDPRQLGALLAKLDSDAFGVRDRATAELEKLGESSGPALRKALEGKPSLEARRRLERLLQRLRRVSPVPERLRELRALEVLERIDGTEVRHILEALARGMPEARLTQEAKAALRRRIERLGSR
jgi:RNA polymerase sigma factor (sigma-70 family)